ncbi:hypothetical protein An11g07460 [Aspergillus niger]|uniref:Uncharacterized protein n=2 Tax=Aspergillus niger TaxID=5061 RepID=A2QX34_ASPNC|nr:hypothetical protein An11g07460 [Aspergillus niger]CAK40790.1 hypothetical protein An11g07460 [Aspergillus niger]
MSPIWPPFLQGVDMRIAHDWATEGELFIRYCLLAPALTVRNRVAGRSRHLTASWYDSISIILSRFSHRPGFLFMGPVLSLVSLDPAQIRLFLCTSISLTGVGSGVVQMGVAYDDF